MEDDKEKDFRDLHDVPLSQSNVSLRLADIQRRCSQLIEGQDEHGGLSLELEDPVAARDGSNPYDRG